MKEFALSKTKSLFWEKLLLLAVMALASANLNAETEKREIKTDTVGLDSLVSEIIAKNPEIQFYKEAIAGAKAGMRYSSSWNDPELSFDVGYKKLRDSDGSKITDGAIWQVSVTQVFEWPGRISLRKAIAQRDVEMAELGVAQFENVLASRARTLAFGLYAAGAKADAIREVADRFKSLKETFLARDPGGVGPMLEIRVIESSELALQRRATEAELAVQSALIELNLLRGAEIDLPIKVRAPSLKFKDIPEPARLVSAARAYNYDFRMRKVELERQGYAVDLARNERYPAISAGPYLSMDRVGEKETIIGLSVSLPLPLTDRTSSAVEAAQSKRRQAETASIVAFRELNRQVLVAAQAYSTKLNESRQWSEDSVKKFRDAAELADRHYRMGTIPIATYVELQNSYLDAVEALLDTQNEILAAGMKLQELTGIDLNPREEIAE